MRRSFLSSSRTLSNYTAIAVALACLASACGSSDDGGGNTPPPGGGGTPGQNPCVTAAQEPGADDLEALARTSADGLASKTNPLDPNPRGRLLDALWLHQSREGRIRRTEGLTTGRSSIDIGEIAVIQDEGDLVEPPNTYDLRSLGLRFTRNGGGGYDVQPDRRRLPHRARHARSR